MRHSATVTGPASLGGGNVGTMTERYADGANLIEKPMLVLREAAASVQSPAHSEGHWPVPRPGNGKGCQLQGNPRYARLNFHI